MSSSLNIKLDTPQAKQLQDILQKEIARRGWSEGEDDAVMSEYIVVMVANKKTQPQIITELKAILGEVQDSALPELEPFVEWVWQEAGRLTDQNGEFMDGSGQRRDSKTTPRRSASPDGRGDQNQAIESRYGESRPTQSIDRSDRWSSGNPAQAERELLSSNEGSQPGEGRMASDAMNSGSRNQKGPVSISIAGRGRGGVKNNLFQRSVEQAHRSNTVAQRKFAQDTTESIFARAGVPNPRAEEFVPGTTTTQTTQPADPIADNLLSRIDPMMPNNAAPPPSKTESTVTDNSSSEFPTQPLDASLCRWGLKCTSPTCIYSHASPSAVTIARQTGEEPLVLRQEPCHYQKDCTKPDCDFSHISPAVKFVLAKAERAASMAFGTNTNVNSTFQHSSENGVADPAFDTAPNNIPCRYGNACYRQDCHFSHPPDRVQHISERMKQFENKEMEGEMEVIIPTA